MVKICFAAISLALALAIPFADLAIAKNVPLFAKGRLSASAGSNWCKPNASASVTAPDKSAFTGDRAELRAFLTDFRSYVPQACPVAQSLKIHGNVGNMMVYTGWINNLVENSNLSDSALQDGRDRQFQLGQSEVRRSTPIPPSGGGYPAQCQSVADAGSFANCIKAMAQADRSKLIGVSQAIGFLDLQYRDLVGNTADCFNYLGAAGQFMQAVKSLTRNAGLYTPTTCDDIQQVSIALTGLAPLWSFCEAPDVSAESIAACWKPFLRADRADAIDKFVGSYPGAAPAAWADLSRCSTAQASMTDMPKADTMTEDRGTDRDS